MHSQVKRPLPLTHGSLKALPISAYKSGQSIKMVSVNSVTPFPTVTSCLCVQKAALSKQDPGMKPVWMSSGEAQHSGSLHPCVCFCYLLQTALWVVVGVSCAVSSPRQKRQLVSLVFSSSFWQRALCTTDSRQRAGSLADLSFLHYSLLKNR